MILVDNESNLECIISSEKLNYIVIEQAEYFERFVYKIYNQINKIEEKLLVYNNDYDLIDISKYCDIIFSAKDISSQEGKLSKKFIKYLIEEITESEINNKLIENHGEFIKILDDIKDISDYEIIFDEEYSIEKVLKNISIKLNELSGSFLERLIEYTKLKRNFFNIDTFFLIGCKIYLSDDDYVHLEKWVNYQNVRYIFIERYDIDIPLNANKYILDNDMCIIN